MWQGLGSGSTGDALLSESVKGRPGRRGAGGGGGRKRERAAVRIEGGGSSESIDSEKAEGSAVRLGDNTSGSARPARDISSRPCLPPRARWGEHRTEGSGAAGARVRPRGTDWARARARPGMLGLPTIAAVCVYVCARACPCAGVGVGACMCV